MTDEKKHDLETLLEQADKLKKLRKETEELSESHGMDNVTAEMRTSLHQVAVTAICAKFLDEDEMMAIVDTWKEYIEAQNKYGAEMLASRPEMKAAYDEMCAGGNDPMAGVIEKRDKVADAFLVIYQSMLSAYQSGQEEESADE